MTKLFVKPSRPRNPFVAAARFRHAGAHGRGARADRHDGRQALRRELAQLEKHSL